MPDKSRPRRYRSVPSLIKKNDQSIANFSIEAQTLFRFLALIVDIKYRNKYGRNFVDSDTQYGSQEQKNNVVADQISSVDLGLLRH